MNMQDYAAERASFRWEPPARFNFARDVIDPWGERDPAKLAMLWVDDHGHEQRPVEVRRKAAFEHGQGRSSSPASPATVAVGVTAGRAGAGGAGSVGSGRPSFRA